MHRAQNSNCREYSNDPIPDLTTCGQRAAFSHPSGVWTAGHRLQGELVARSGWLSDQPEGCQRTHDRTGRKGAYCPRMELRVITQRRAGLP